MESVAEAGKVKKDKRKNRRVVPIQSHRAVVERTVAWPPRLDTYLEMYKSGELDKQPIKFQYYAKWQLRKFNLIPKRELSSNANQARLREARLKAKAYDAMILANHLSMQSRSYISIEEQEKSNFDSKRDVSTSKVEASGSKQVGLEKHEE